MTKQEKIAVKSSLLPLQHQLFQDQWDDLVSDHPYVLQDDDDIEDDVLGDIHTQIDQVEIGRRKMVERASAISNREELKSTIESIGEAFNTGTIQLLMGCAIGDEMDLGLYLRSNDTYIHWDSSNAGLVITYDEDEAAYLLHLGYKRLSDIKPIKSNQ